jgi:hypothetical protein
MSPIVLTEILVVSLIGSGQTPSYLELSTDRFLARSFQLRVHHSFRHSILHKLSFSQRLRINHEYSWDCRRLKRKPRSKLLKQIFIVISMNIQTSFLR